jgi:RimJ/RimL family protein N-acetyltransferase
MAASPPSASAPAPVSLEPLLAAHAERLFPLLSDRALYEYLDYGPPPDVEHLRSVYRRLESRQSPDGSERWLNWAISTAADGVVGYVQATVFRPASAWVAYVLGRPFWGRGYARAAVSSMLELLRSDHECTRFLACVERDNARSIALLRTLQFAEATRDEAAGHSLSPTERLYLRELR